MTNLKKVVAGSLVGVGLLASPTVFAGATGNVGAFSEYLFRGISQGGGAAVQGGLDYGHDSGLYAGTWVSNIGFGGASSNAFTDGSSSEVDLYGGFAGKIGSFGYDLGVLYYWYPEEDEPDLDLSTFEVYVGGTFGPVGLKYYYSNEANFFGLDGTAVTDGDDGDVEAAGYLLGTLALPITDSLNFTASLGLYDGDEVERFLTAIGADDDTYLDYSIGIAKSIEGGMTFTLQLADTDIEVADGEESAGFDDDPKVIVGFKKVFDL